MRELPKPFEATCRYARARGFFRGGVAFARLKGAASLERAAEKILAMLREPEYVRLGAYELPDNPGRLCIPAKALREWARSSPAGDGPAA